MLALSFVVICSTSCFVTTQEVEALTTTEFYDDEIEDTTNAPVMLGTVLQRNMVMPCQTPAPDNKVGVCVPIKKCPSLLALLANQTAVDFLRQSKAMCDLKNQQMSNRTVCCQWEQAVDESNAIAKDQQIEEGPLPKVCGHQNVVLKTRIYGGKQAVLGEFPWLARLIHKDAAGYKTFGCTGFLIAPKFVLTAAHCLKSDNIDILGPIFEVQLGEHNTATKLDCADKNRTCADKPQVIRIKKNIVHPDYVATSSHHHHDIGLIHLRKATKYTNYVAPICILEQVDFEPFEYWISGWGTTEAEQMSTVKLKVSLTPFPHSNCTKKYAGVKVQINNRQICAGGVKNRDSCTGDSGGPLMVVKDKNHWFAAGVVSYGLGCGRQGWPGVYTNITSYRNWITKTILKRVTTKGAAKTTKTKR